MPIPWLVVLQNVPWTDVVRNAPKVADAAKKLWNTVSRRPEQSSSSTDVIVPNESPDSPYSGLETRVAMLEAVVSDLHNQMLASSELIKALADQNGQLVVRIEANRMRMIWISFIIGATFIIAMVSLAIVVQQELNSTSSNIT